MSKGKITAHLSRRAHHLLATLGGWASCLFLIGYTTIDTAMPLRLEGDHLFVLNYAKSFINGYGWRFNPALGFPGVQDHLYFPTSEFSHKALLWIAAQVSTNPFRVVHLMYVVAIMGMFSISYWALLRLEIRSLVAAIAAVSYVVSPYFASRAPDHTFLGLYYAVPSGAALALLATAIPDTVAKFCKRPFILASIVIVASSGPYYAFFTILFALFTCTAASMAQGRLRPMIAASAVTICIIVLWAGLGFGFGLRQVLAGTVTLPIRYPMEQLYFGLPIAESAYVFRGIPLLEHAIQNYLAMFSLGKGKFPGIGDGVFEWPGLFLTVVVLASPLILLATSLRPKQEDYGRQQQVTLLSSACIVFGLLFAARGGLGLLFNLTFTPAIRAQARVMPFLSFYAIVIVCAAIEAALRSSRSWISAGLPIALSLALIGALVPPSFPLAATQQRTLTDAVLRNNREELAELLKRKDRAGAQAVLQLPFLPWPEMPLQHGFDPYQHQLPFIFDEPRSATRWSYGLTNRQPEYSAILQRLSPDQANGLPGRAMALGYDALLIEKRAYDVSELGTILAYVESEVGPRCRIYDDQYRVFFILTSDPQDRRCT